MAASKKKRLEKIIILAYLVVFPFGQLLKQKISIFGLPVSILAVDLIAATSLIFLIKKKNRHGIEKYITAFLLSAAFSYVISIFIFKDLKVIFGAFYFFRILTYFSFFLLSRKLSRGKITKDYIIKSLVSISAIVAVFGWIQYLFLPDLRHLYYLGWDDHLFRLVGSFLDPGFTGIILVLGLLLSLNIYLNSKKSSFLILTLFLLLTVAFTYSRASYVSLIVGFAAILLMKKAFRKTVLFLCAIFILMISFLPRPQSSGVELERTYSIYSRITDYSKTVQVWKKSPLFGVGFNNLCLAKQKYLKNDNFESHSCSGSDSSLLLVLATTGVVGFVLFLNLIIQLFKHREKGIYGEMFLISLMSVLTHSLFVNSLFYTWVMGWMALLAGLSLGRKNVD